MGRRSPARSACPTRREPRLPRPPASEEEPMKLSITTFEGSDAGSLDLSDEIFGLEPRADILQRVVRWQLAKRQAGTHKTLGRSEINRTKKKIYKQKGPGGAAVPRRRTGLRSRRAQPWPRPAQEGEGARAAPCAVGQGQGAAAHRRR